MSETRHVSAGKKTKKLEILIIWLRKLTFDYQI